MEQKTWVPSSPVVFVFKIPHVLDPWGPWACLSQYLYTGKKLCFFKRRDTPLLLQKCSYENNSMTWMAFGTTQPANSVANVASVIHQPIPTPLYCQWHSVSSSKT